ncbi:hypothetical protein LCGC14_2702950, partial [marine sediment metagenome]
HRVIVDSAVHDICDAQYVGFLYFNDFGLDALTWKLGGHVDDHREKAPGKPRRGFFETALGNVSIEANLSKPLTDDPWLLNQIVHETQRFVSVQPHSLHLSLQLRRQQNPSPDRLLPLEVFKCLFALAGDLAPGPDQRLRIARLTDHEIVGKDLPTGADKNTTPHMLFSEISRRRGTLGSTQHDGLALPDSGGRYIQQFKFMRLSPALNYEPIALALKGIQISLRPGTFLTAGQYDSSRRHRRTFEELMAWAKEPTVLTDAQRRVFLEAVRDGLMSEKRGKPAHGEAYIAWAIGRIRAMLRAFNATVKEANATGAAPRS